MVNRSTSSSVKTPSNSRKSVKTSTKNGQQLMQTMHQQLTQTTKNGQQLTSISTTKQNTDVNKSNAKANNNPKNAPSTSKGVLTPLKMLKLSAQRGKNKLLAGIGISSQSQLQQADIWPPSNTASSSVKSSPLVLHRVNTDNAFDNDEIQQQQPDINMNQNTTQQSYISSSSSSAMVFNQYSSNIVGGSSLNQGQLVSQRSESTTSTQSHPTVKNKLSQNWQSEKYSLWNYLDQDSNDQDSNQNLNQEELQYDLDFARQKLQKDQEIARDKWLVNGDGSLRSGREISGAAWGSSYLFNFNTMQNKEKQLKQEQVDKQYDQEMREVWAIKWRMQKSIDDLKRDRDKAFGFEQQWKLHQQQDLSVDGNSTNSTKEKRNSATQHLLWQFKNSSVTESLLKQPKQLANGNNSLGSSSSSSSSTSNTNTNDNTSWTNWTYTQALLDGVNKMTHGFVKNRLSKAFTMDHSTGKISLKSQDIATPNIDFSSFGTGRKLEKNSNETVLWQQLKQKGDITKSGFQNQKQLQSQNNMKNKNNQLKKSSQVTQDTDTGTEDNGIGNSQSDSGDDEQKKASPKKKRKIELSSNISRGRSREPKQVAGSSKLLNWKQLQNWNDTTTKTPENGRSSSLAARLGFAGLFLPIQQNTNSIDDNSINANNNEQHETTSNANTNTNKKSNTTRKRHSFPGGTSRPPSQSPTWRSNISMFGKSGRKSIGAMSRASSMQSMHSIIDEDDDIFNWKNDPEYEWKKKRVLSRTVSDLKKPRDRSVPTLKKSYCPCGKCPAAPKFRRRSIPGKEMRPNKGRRNSLSPEGKNKNNKDDDIDMVDEDEFDCELCPEAQAALDAQKQ